MRRPPWRIDCSPLALALLACLSLVARATAQSEDELAGPSATTTWAVRIGANSRCATSRAFLNTLAAQIPSGQRVDELRAELVAEVTIEESVAHIRVFDRVLQSEAGARDLPLTSRYCDDIADSVALVIGVLVEAGRGALGAAPAPRAEQKPPSASLPAPRKPEPSPGPPPRGAGATPAVRPSGAGPVKRERPVWRGPPAGHDFEAAVGGNFGLLPTPVLGLTAGWGVRPASTWPIWLHVTGWAGADSDDGHARFRSLYGTVATCPLAGSLGPLRLRACVGLSAGGIWAEPRDLPQEFEQRRPVALAGMEGAASLPLAGPLQFTLIARGDALLMRTRFYYETDEGGRDFVYDPSVVFGGLFAGLSLRFR